MASSERVCSAADSNGCGPAAAGLEELQQASHKPGRSRMPYPTKRVRPDGLAQDGQTQGRAQAAPGMLVATLDPRCATRRGSRQAAAAAEEEEAAAAAAAAAAARATSMLT